MYDYNVDKVTVNAGGTLDVVGQDARYGVTIAGTGSAGQGALINSGANVSSTSIQTPNIALSADASIGGSGHLYMIAPSYDPNFLYLNGHTLTKIGANTFGIVNSTIDKGTILIEEGTLGLFNRASAAPETTFQISESSGATLNLNNFNFVVGALSGGGNVNLGSATFDVGWLPISTTYAGTISGSGRLIKRGIKTLTLSGDSTYTGQTIVYNGGLILNGSLTSDISIGGDGWLSGNGSTTGILELNGGFLIVAGDDDTKPGLTVDGVQFPQATRIEFNSGPTAGKTYEILRYGSSGVTQYENLLCDYRGTLTNDTVNQIIKFIATGDGHSIRTWNTQDGTWDMGISSNWAEGDNLYHNGDHAVFGNISTDTIVNISGTLYPASVTIANESHQLDLSGGTISGITDLRKTGNGTALISMVNYYKGNTLVEGGTLKVGHGLAFGHKGAYLPIDRILVSPGATVDFNGIFDATYGYKIAGDGVNSAGALVNNGSAITTAKAQCTSIELLADASIGGTGEWALLTSKYGPTTLNLNGYTLTKTGENVISLCNSTISTGTVRIASGTLRQHSSGIVEGSKTMFQLDNNATALLLINNINTTLGGIGGGGAFGGTISLGSGTLTVGTLNEPNTFHGSFAGSGTLIKTGTNTLTITGKNSDFTGDVLVNEGTLKLDNYDQLNILGSTRYDVNKIQVADGATFDIGGLDNTRYGVTITGSGVDGQGAWINSGGNTSSSRIQTPFLELAGDAAVGGSGDFFMIYASFGPSSITLNGHTLTKTGNNTFTVAGTTIATGKVHIAQGVFAQHSTLNAASVDAGFARFSLADTTGVTLLLNNKNFIAGSLEGGGANGGLVSLGSGVLTLGNLATNAVFSGTISGSGGITKVGEGIQSFNGIYNYSGATVISNGTLAVNGVHQTGGDYTVTDGATLAGTGTVALAAGSTVTVQENGTIAPGAQPLEGGTLQLSALNLEQGSSIVIDNPSDLIHVTGNLDIADASVVFADITLYDKQLSYPLISCDGVISGEFNKDTGDPLWIVSRRGNSFALIYSSGTLMMVR